MIQPTIPKTGDKWLPTAEFSAGNGVRPSSVWKLWKSGRVVRRGNHGSYEYRWAQDGEQSEPVQVPVPKPAARVFYDPSKDKYLAAGPGLAFVGQLGGRVREIVEPLVSAYDLPPDLPIAKRLPAIDVTAADDGLIVYVGLTDIHFGYGDADELAQFIDDRITEAMAPILRGYGRPAHIVIPVGSDALHVDTYIGTTTRGTYVAPTMTAREGYDHAARFYARCIDRLRTIATDQVHLVYCAGNHDRLMSHALMHCMEGRYLGERDVVIHSDPDRAKGKDSTTLSIGRVMIHVEHGDRKGPTIEQVMAAHPSWSACALRVAFTGHFHHSAIKEHDNLFHIQCRAPANHTEYERSKEYRAARGLTVAVLNMAGRIEWIRP